MSGCARIGGRTRAQIVWDAIQAAPEPLDLAAVKLACAGYGLTQNGIVKQLYTLSERCHLERIGVAGKFTYRATGPRPIDRRPESCRAAGNVHRQRLSEDSNYRSEFGSKVTGGKTRLEKGEPMVQRQQGRPPPLPSLTDLLKTPR